MNQQQTLAITLLILFTLCMLFFEWVSLLNPQKQTRTPGSPRELKPKTQNDCPHCVEELLLPPLYPPPLRSVPPYSEIKGKGGRPKRISTQWYFCPHPDCLYYLIADQTIHALIGYGSHGKHENIQNFFCQSCHRKFTCRRNTILYRLHTLSQTVVTVLHLAALGCDISALAEVFKKHECTIRMWLTRAGHFGRKLHNLFFRHLYLAHLQLDELHARVKHAAHAIWLWVAMDAASKLIPVIQLGERSQAQAYAFGHELRRRMAWDCVPVFSTDGLQAYFSTLTAHFGAWQMDPQTGKRVWILHPDFLYGQVIKTRSRFRLKSVTRRLLFGSPDEYLARLKRVGLRGTINTAYVERVNLTLRRQVSKLMRRTWATAQYGHELEDHLFWWLSVYHFVRPHESLKLPLSQPIFRRGRQRPRHYLKRTPALAAGLTSRVWSVRDLLFFPIP